MFIQIEDKIININNIEVVVDFPRYGVCKLHMISGKEMRIPMSKKEFMNRLPAVNCVSL